MGMHFYLGSSPRHQCGVMLKRLGIKFPKYLEVVATCESYERWTAFDFVYQGLSFFQKLDDSKITINPVQMVWLFLIFAKQNSGALNLLLISRRATVLTRIL